VSILTLKHTKIRPKIIGTDKSTEVTEKLYFFNILKIIEVNPTENMIEKKYE
tara:strand:- start:70 stop:225 length:156 start_codon:yes stop_codon:yes gene_type:complete